MREYRVLRQASACAIALVFLGACVNSTMPSTQQAPSAIPLTPLPSTTPTLELPTWTPESKAGRAGIGDPYYPQLGNGGYDVSHYTIALDVDPDTNAVIGTTTIEAKALEPLNAFNLDLQGLTVDAVSVNAEPATFSRQEHELTIVPRGPIAPGTFSTRVSYRGNPEPVKSVASSLFALVGWFHSDNGVINVINEPNGAAGWFPVNDHPRDKATFRFEITVPATWVVAASGSLRETNNMGARTRYVWEMTKPMASYLASINIDHYVIATAQGPGGIKIRSYFPSDLSDRLKNKVAKLPEMIEYFNRVFGPYPFDEYGIVVTAKDIPPCGTPVGGADEAQTMSVHCPDDKVLSEDVVAHELAHQWFGNDVSIKNWQDLWLKEGMATYAEWLWFNRTRDVKALDEYVAAQKLYYFPATKPGQPPVDDLYQLEDYTGGALTIHALRLRVGDVTFFKVLHTYRDRYHFGNAGTDDFIAVAEEISGQELGSFFDSWLLETVLPELPKRAN